MFFLESAETHVTQISETYVDVVVVCVVEVVVLSEIRQSCHGILYNGRAVPAHKVGASPRSCEWQAVSQSIMSDELARPSIENTGYPYYSLNGWHASTIRYEYSRMIASTEAWP